MAFLNDGLIRRAERLACGFKLGQPQHRNRKPCRYCPNCTIRGTDRMFPAAQRFCACDCHPAPWLSQTNEDAAIWARIAARLEHEPAYHRYFRSMRTDAAIMAAHTEVPHLHGPRAGAVYL